MLRFVRKASSCGAALLPLAASVKTLIKLPAADSCSHDNTVQAAAGHPGLGTAGERRASRLPGDTNPPGGVQSNFAATDCQWQKVKDDRYCVVPFGVPTLHFSFPPFLTDSLSMTVIQAFTVIQTQKSKQVLKMKQAERR